MKKVLLIAICTIFLGAGVVQAQSSYIGARFGGSGSVSGAEFTYVKGLSDKTQFEINAGGGLYYLKPYGLLTGSFQWKFQIGSIDGFHWYIGPAAGVKFYTYSSNLYIGAGVQGGVSYEFDFPLQLALDVRSLPFGINLNDSYWFDADFGACVRYRIGG